MIQAKATPVAPAPADQALLGQLIANLERLREETAESNALSRERERIIDRLHEENKRLQTEALDRFLEPVLRDLIRLSDDLRQTLSAHSAGDREGGPLLADLRSYHDAVLDILYRQGVEPFAAEPGAPFDARLHRALASVPTPEVAQDRTIARVVRVGFASASRVLRPLETEVYRLVRPAVADPQGAVTAGDAGAVSGQ